MSTKAPAMKQHIHSLWLLFLVGCGIVQCTSPTVWYPTEEPSYQEHARTKEKERREAIPDRTNIEQEPSTSDSLPSGTDRSFSIEQKRVEQTPEQPPFESPVSEPLPPLPCEIQPLPQPVCPRCGWVRRFGGPYRDGGKDLMIDRSGAIYLLGWIELQGGVSQTIKIGSIPVTRRYTQTYLIKLDPNGNPLWANASSGVSGLETPTANGSSLAMDQRRNTLYWTGSYLGNIRLGQTILPTYYSHEESNPDLFATQMDTATGLFGWAIRAGGESLKARSLGEEGHDIVVDSAGYLYITGYFGGTASFGSFQLDAKSHKRQIFLAKLSPQGKFVWVLHGQQGGGEGYNLAIGPQGHVYLSGSIQGHNQVGNTTVTTKQWQELFVAKVSPGGQVLWSATTSTLSNPFQYQPAISGYGTQSMALAPDGTLYIAALFAGHIQWGTHALKAKGDRDLMISKLDPNTGKVLWLKTYPVTNTMVFPQLTLDCQGNLYLLGNFEKEIVLGKYKLKSEASIQDAFVAKLTTQGDVLWATQTKSVEAASVYALQVNHQGHLFLTGQFKGQTTFGVTTLHTQGKSDMFLWKIQPPSP